MAFETQSFLDHLEALRRTILGNLAVLALLVIPAWLLIHFQLQELLKILSRHIPGCRFYFLTPLEPFFLELKLTLAAAFLMGLPVHLWLWGKFLAPALYQREKHLIALWGGAALLLFCAGALLALGAVLPMILRFSAGFATEAWQPMLTLSSVVSLAILLALGFGAAFELPLAVLLAVRGGLIRVETLKRQRPAVLVGILVLSAILTPPDVLSQCLMAFPAYALFELALLIAGRRKEIPEPEEIPAEPVLPEPVQKSPPPQEEPAPEPAMEEYHPLTVYERTRRGIRRGRPRRFR